MVGIGIVFVPYASGLVYYIEVYIKQLIVPAKVPITLTSRKDYSGLRGFLEKIFLLKISY